jgi:hypothetical protein
VPGACFVRAKPPEKKQREKNINHEGEKARKRGIQLQMRFFVFR